MKKTLLLFAMLLGVVGAWAQIDLSNPIVTFTNVQKDSTMHILYVDNTSNKLMFKTVEQSVEATLNELGGYAQFRAITKDGGKVAFYNESTSKYMIWRGSSGGYNGNTGLTDEYNSTYCDWSLTRDIHHEPGTFFICSKRNNGSDGTLLYNKTKSSSDFFDNYSNNIGWNDNYSNLFRISGLPVVECVLKDELGKLYNGEIEFLGKPLLNANYIISNEQWDGSVFKADITFPFAVSDADNANPMIISVGDKTWGENKRKWYADGENIKITRDLEPTLENINSYLWTVHIDEFKGGEFFFKIMNFNNKKYIYTDKTSSNHDLGALVLSQDKASIFNLSSPNKDNQKEYHSFFTKSGETYLYLSVAGSGSGTQYVGVNSYEHVGTSITTISCKLNYNLTDNAGNSYTGEFYGWSQLEPTPVFSGTVYELENEQWIDNQYVANITFPFPVSKKNGVTNPTMISSFKGDSHQADGSFLWYADNGIVKIKKHVEIDNNNIKVASEKNIISYLWALYPKCKNGVFSVGIWNIGAGNYISFDKEYDNDQGSENEAEDVKLENEKMTPFYVAANNAFYHTINGKEHRLSFGSVNNNSGNLGVYVKNHAGTYNSFHTPAITTQISDAKYSTICLPFAANLPKGVEAYSIETVNATYATLTSKEGLPANTGAILKAEPGYYTFTQTEEKIDTWDDNLLYGSVEDIYWYGDGYVLSKQNGVVALYKGKLNYILKDGVPEKVTEGGKYFKNNAGKALLPTTSLIADARFLVFSFGDDMETGITETENGNVETENAEVYDLSGRRVQNAKKGIFVINGKVVVK